jgi:hypothetical protein
MSQLTDLPNSNLPIVVHLACLCTANTRWALCTSHGPLNGVCCLPLGDLRRKSSHTPLVKGLVRRHRAFTVTSDGASASSRLLAWSVLCGQESCAISLAFRHTWNAVVTVTVTDCGLSPQRVPLSLCVGKVES